MFPFFAFAFSVSSAALSALGVTQTKGARWACYVLPWGEKEVQLICSDSIGRVPF